MTFHTKDIPTIEKELHTSSTKGLTEKRAQELLASHGPNELAQGKKTPAIIIFFSQFKSFIIYILLFAILLSILQGEYVDATVILIILLVNAVVGFIQEYRAQSAIDSLKALSAHKVEVTRGGKRFFIDAVDLVPGDLIHISEGSKVPADARLVTASGLYVQESSLTGESVAVMKDTGTYHEETPLADRKNMVFSSTLVTRGKATAVVVATGMDTQIGKIATMITTVEAKLTPLQKKLDKLGQRIGLFTLIISLAILITGLFTENLLAALFAGDYVTFLAGAGKWLLLAVALAVAAVPEGLPAIVTIALSIGVKKMVHRNALIRHLPSVETLGETTVICSDKTGTLTQNEMTVRHLYTYGNEFELTGSGYDTKGSVVAKGKTKMPEKLLLLCGTLCSNARLKVTKQTVSAIGDPTEAALLVSAKKCGHDYERLNTQYKEIYEEPFDAVRKLMSSVRKAPDKNTYVFTKGAPERVLAISTHILIDGKVKPLTAAMKTAIKKQNESYANHAMRVLGFAYKTIKPQKSYDAKIERQMIFIGLQAMIDPPRPQVKDALAKCATAGIKVFMITGDNKVTAQAIAKEIGLDGKAMEGVDFEKLSKKEQKKALKQVRIFARVEPQHKMAIVTLLQEMGEIVAMTGDGVNDAPAIKKADLGIAMGKSGTDVAKESSEMILLDDNFSSIVGAIEEGRGIFANVKKFVNYLLSSNLGEVFVIFFAVIIFGVESLPLTAIMLLWLNLVTDGLPALALSVDPTPKDIMHRKPVAATKGIMTKKMMFHIVLVALLITAGVLGLFKWADFMYGDLMHMQTIAFTTIIALELVRLQTIRSEDRLSMFSNRWLVLAVLSSIALQLLVIYTPLHTFFGTVPLSLGDWMMIIGVSIGVYFLNLLGGRAYRALAANKDHNDE